MRTSYFDMKDGVPIRDRVGLQFPTAEHSKELARRFGHEHLETPTLLSLSSTSRAAKFIGSRCIRCGSAAHL